MMQRYSAAHGGKPYPTSGDGEWVRWEDAKQYRAVVDVLAEMGNPAYMYYPFWLTKLILLAKNLVGRG